MLHWEISSKIILGAILMLLTIVFGFILHKWEKPYNTFVFTIHELIALGFVVYTSIYLIQCLKNMELGSWIITLIFLGLLCLLTLFVTGALLNIGKLPKGTLLLFHNISALVTALIGFFAIILMINN